MLRVKVGSQSITMFYSFARIFADIKPLSEAALPIRLHPSGFSRDQSRRESPFVLDLAEARRAREQARQSESVESLQGRRDGGDE